MRFSLLAVATGLLALPVAARADSVTNDWTNDSISLVYAYPTATTTYATTGPVTVSSTGSQTNFFGEIGITLFPTQIQIQDISATPYTFLSGNGFNGIEFTDTSANAPVITGASLMTGSVLDPVVTFTSNEVFVNFAGLTATDLQTAVVNLQFAPATSSSVTPEPASIALLGTGLLGVAGTMRRRFVRL